MLCPNQHETAEGANFCHICGTSLSATTVVRPELVINRGPTASSILGVPTVFTIQGTDRIGNFGRNHEEIARAVAAHKGGRFSSAKLGEMVMRSYPNFSPGSLLFNDHAEGNAGACRCAGTEDRIFDQIARGYYYVRDLGVAATTNASNELEQSTQWEDTFDLRADTFGVLASQDEFRGQKFSDWLFGEAISDIEAQLNNPRFRVEVLSGNRGGRYPSIGIKVLGQQAWAIGFDGMYDFDLDSVNRPTKPPYCGWRGGSTHAGSGAEGRLRHAFLKEIFDGDEWLRPDRWWSTYRDLPFTGDGSVTLDGTAYRKFVVDTFVQSFLTLRAAVQRRQEIEP